MLSTVLVYTKIGYLSIDIVSSKKQRLFKGQSSRKSVSFDEHIMSKVKYLSILSCQMESFVFIILQHNFGNRALRYSPISVEHCIQSYDTFRPIVQGQKKYLLENIFALKIIFLVTCTCS